MDAADGCDLLGWHSSLAVMEDREEEDTDGLEPAVRLGHAGLDQQWGSQIGGRVHPVRFQQASHNLVLSTFSEIAVNRQPAKLVSDRICGFAAAHNPPHLHRGLKQSEYS